MTAMGEVYCSNNECPQFRNTGSRRYIGDGMTVGERRTKHQCRKCGKWSFAGVTTQAA